MTTIATNEPLEARAGLTWAWQRQDLSSDYPAPTWTLTYYFKNAAANFSFAASASGVYFAVARTAAQTSALTAGRYDWVAIVSDGTNKYQVDNGSLNVLADYTAVTNIDSRSHARKVLEAIRAVIENRATLDQEEYAINNRSLKRTPMADLIMLADKYDAMVKGEEAAERINNGLRPKNRLLARFRT